MSQHNTRCCCSKLIYYFDVHVTLCFYINSRQPCYIIILRPDYNNTGRWIEYWIFQRHRWRLFRLYKRALFDLCFLVLTYHIFYLIHITCVQKCCNDQKTAFDQLMYVQTSSYSIIHYTPTIVKIRSVVVPWTNKLCGHNNNRNLINCSFSS